MLPTLLAAAGCVRTLELPDSGAPAETGVPDTSAADTSGDTDDTSETGDTSDPGVCVPGQTTGFTIPNARWALASLHGARRFGDLADSALSLPPSWFLATAWERTAFDCADYGEPWVESDEWSDTGCLDIHQDTVWIELSRLFPQYFADGAYDGAVSGDRPEVGVMALTWYALATHAMLGRYVDDPEAWYAAAGDPLAAEKLTALMHHSGAWSGYIEAALDGCADAVEGCVEGEALAHVEGVVEKMQALDGAECFDGALTAADIERYTGELASIWPEQDWGAATEAATAALTGAGFAADAPLALDALDAQITVRLVCPEQELKDWYRLSCP